MSGVRTAFGAILGAVVAGTALRLRSEARRRGVPITDLLADVPELIGEDLRRVSQAAEDAVQDGKRAAHETEERIGKVLSRPRQT